MRLLQSIAVALVICALVAPQAARAQSASERAFAAAYQAQGLDAKRDSKMIATFRAVQLSADDYAYLRLGWEPFDILTAAARAREFGFEGRAAVSDMLGMKEEEMDLWRAYRKASSDAERRDIRSRIDAVPRVR